MATQTYQFRPPANFYDSGVGTRQVFPSNVASAEGASEANSAFDTYMLTHPSLVSRYRLDRSWGVQSDVKGFAEASPVGGVPGAYQVERIDGLRNGELGAADSYAVDFGEDIPANTITVAPVGVGTVTGTFTFAAWYGDDDAPYPHDNQAFSEPITVSGVASIDATVDGAEVGDTTCNFSVTRASDDMWSTLSSGTPAANFDASELMDDLTFTYATMEALPGDYLPKQMRLPAAHFSAGDVHNFAGTTPFSVICDLSHEMWLNQHPDKNWVVSCFNADYTEGWGIAVYLISYNSLVIQFERRNAAGQDICSLGYSGGPYSDSVTHTHTVEATYDGTNMKLYYNHSLLGPPAMDTEASSRSIDATDPFDLRLGDRFVGRLDDVCIFDDALSHAELEALRLLRAEFINIGQWLWRAQTDAIGIAVPDLRKDDADPALATTLWLTEVDDVGGSGTNRAAELATVTTGKRLRVRYPTDEDLPATFEAEWLVESDAVDLGTYWEIEVSAITDVGDSTNFGEDHWVSVSNT